MIPIDRICINFRYECRKYWCFYILYNTTYTISACYIAYCNKLVLPIKKGVGEFG